MIEEQHEDTMRARLYNLALPVAETDAVISELPFNGAASFCKGAVRVPHCIRSIATHIPPTIEEGKLLARLKLRDPGDPDPGVLTREACFAETEEPAFLLFDRSYPFLTGGDHSVAILYTKAAPPVCCPEGGVCRNGGSSVLPL
jgi:arginase family enzyme